MPSVKEVDGSYPWTARIDIVDAPSLQLVLPARKEMVDNAALASLRVAVQATIYRTIATESSHRLSFQNWQRAADLGIDDGERVLVSSPRGSVEMGVRVQPDIPAGLTFTTFHFPDLVDINLITNDEWDRDSGTAEFKAASIRVEKLTSA